MNRIVQILSGVALIWLGTLTCSDTYNALVFIPEVRHSEGPPIIELIRKMSELTVLEVQITKVVTEKISGHTGGTSVVVLVHGDVFLGVDLEQAQFIEVEQERRHLVLSLPPPTVRRVAIDHRTSQVLHSGRQGLWRLAVGPALEDQAIAKAFILGEQRLQDAAERTQLINRAMQHAESVIGRFADETEWTLEVRWAE